MYSYKNMHKIKAYHYQAMTYRIAGYNYKEIADLLGYAHTTIKNWFLLDDVFRAEFQKFEKKGLENAKRILEEASVEAANKIVDLLDNKNAQVSLNSAKDILDRTGLVAKQKVEIDANVKHAQVDEKLLDDPEAVEMLRKLFEKGVEGE